jgi:HAD superfamily hydrolase (TIGR01549 family)
MFKHLIFDFDNTIYDYDSAHKIALLHIFDMLSKKYNIHLQTIRENFIRCKEKYQNKCYGHASSHNKFAQFKNLFQMLNIKNENNVYATELSNCYEMYITTFNENLELYDGILEFLDFCLSQNINMYMLTNNLCKEQMEKIKLLNIEKYFKKIYTSEEYGIEKPDHKLFYYLITDIGCTKEDIANIGDSYENDIMSSRIAGMYSFWFNNKFNNKNKMQISDTTFEFRDYTKLLNWFTNYYSECNKFTDYSHYVGERFDLTQAGGGNTSFKYDDLLFIKSSGTSLSSININENYVGVNYKNILHEFEAGGIRDMHIFDKKKRESISKKYVESNIIFLKKYKPSIETSLHIYTKKYTIHIHPIQFNMISSLPNCEEILQQLFGSKNINYCVLNYATPGIDITIELLKKYKYENIIFMKNHGLIITSNSIGELYITLNETLDVLETYVSNINNNIVLDLKKYKYVNVISSTMKEIYTQKYISYLSEDTYMYQNLKKYIDNPILFNTFFPDKLVYCGNSCIVINTMMIKNNLHKEIYNYMNKYGDIPKIIIIRNKKQGINSEEDILLYITSNSLKKCIEIESVFKSHLLCFNPNNILLPDEEIKYLQDWDAERYRQII